MTQTLCQFGKIEKRYDQQAVVEIDSLELLSNELLCLLGPTGSGKSTLLRILARVELSDVGLDESFEPQLPQRDITLVFQRPLLLKGSVRTNVEYGLRVRNQLSGNQRRVDELLDRLELTSIQHQSAQTLSGGQMQLTALARGLAIQPRLLLLDEPTASLDPSRVALCEQVVREEQEQHKMTVVWATHNLFQARRVGHRAALLLDGKLVELANVEEFFNHPHDPRTRDYIEGKMIY